MKEEIWKIVIDTRIEKNGSKSSRGKLYEVSNFGNVRINGKIITDYSKFLNWRGYIRIRPIGTIHRAVAKLFIPNPENKPEVDHIDTNILNNRVDNLRWVTHKENMNNSITLQNKSKAFCGEKNPFYGKKHTEEAKKKMIEARKKYWKYWNLKHNISIDTKILNNI